MSFIDVIAKKRDGLPLLRADIDYAHFCHRRFLKVHWPSLKTPGLRSFLRFWDHFLHSLCEPMVYRRARRVPGRRRAGARRPRATRARAAHVRRLAAVDKYLAAGAQPGDERLHANIASTDFLRLLLPDVDLPRRAEPDGFRHPTPA